MSRRAMVAPALLATIGVLAAAKFALLAHGAVRALSAPAALETPVVAGKAAAGPDMEPAAGPGENTAAASAPERAAAPPAPQPTSARVVTGPAPRLALDRLSQSEIEVLQLVAAGRSNGEIGTALFISTKTASVHVSNILAKLGVSGRGEAAALAHRVGLAVN